jgi:hypothetical protein
MNLKSLLVESPVDVNALGNALNNSFGRSSTTKSHTYSVKGVMQGKFMILSFAMVVNFPSGIASQDKIKDYEKESKKITADALRQIKSEYKADAGKALSCKEVNSSTHVEYISANMISRTAYFKRVTRYELT